METRWKNALENNGTVQVKIELIYIGNSKRPDKFIIQEKLMGCLKFMTISTTIQQEKQ